MASHFRVSLRDAMLARLTGLGATQDRVFANRLYPLQGAELPGLTIKVIEPEIRAATIHAPVMYERKAEIVVCGFAKDTGDVGLLLDDIGLQVEIALSTALEVAGKFIDIRLSEVAFDVAQSDQPTGMIQMTYVATVYASADDPSVLK